MAQTVADVLVAVLEQIGVKHIFGLIGDSSNPLADAVRRSRLQWIGVRHEEGAALAAAGQAKITGRLLVSAGMTGPGSNHLVAGLYEASRAHAPVLALSGDMPRKLHGTDYIQTTERDLLFRDVSLYTETVSSPAQSPGELEAIAIGSAHTIEIGAFVPKREIDELYWNTPYYVAPEVGQQAFAVIREAIGKESMVALGRVVFTTREHVIAIEPRGKGLLGITLRYPYEIRSEEDYFGDLPDEKVPKDMLDLAVHVIQQGGPFYAGEFEDCYEKALKELIQKKQQGKKIEKPKEHAQRR